MMRNTSPHRVRLLSMNCALAGLLAAAGGGCAVFRTGGPSGSLSLESFDTGERIQPRITSAAYKFVDQNTADIYLTDLPEDRLLSERPDVSGMSGTLIHIRLFLVPKAGKTPIDDTACNAAFRTIVVASSEGGAGSSGVRTEAGMYEGGGFLYPSDRPGESVLAGSVFGSSARLTAGSPGFADRITPGMMDGKFRAPRDDDRATEFAAAFETLSRSLTPATQEP